MPEPLLKRSFRPGPATSLKEETGTGVFLMSFPKFLRTQLL